MRADRCGIGVALFVVLLGAVTPALVRAQPAPVPNRAGEFQVGYSYHWYHRNMPPTAPVEKEWEVATLTATFGATERVTVGLSGGFWHVDYDEFPGTDYERYVAGIGVSSWLYRSGGSGVMGEVQFSEVLDLDRSDNQFHKTTRSVLVGAYVATSWQWRSSSVDVWGGPVYVRDVGKNYFFGAVDPLDDNADALGGVVGARTVWRGRLLASAWLVVADYAEPRVAVGVRL